MTGPQLVPEGTTTIVEEPTAWPACSVCGIAYAYKRVLSFGRGFMWVWLAECRHPKKDGAEPKLATADGFVTEEEG